MHPRDGQGVTSWAVNATRERDLHGSLRARCKNTFVTRASTAGVLRLSYVFDASCTTRPSKVEDAPNANSCRVGCKVNVSQASSLSTAQAERGSSNSNVGSLALLEKLRASKLCQQRNGQTSSDSRRFFRMTVQGKLPHARVHAALNICVNMLC